MSLLLAQAALRDRRGVVSGALAPLASSLDADLARVAAAHPDLPAVKAELSRTGGRCARDGALLEFDPWEPHRHRCARCGDFHVGEVHDRWWVMGYQLWLAERAAQAAALAAVQGTAVHRELARHILDRAAERYLSYPNADNVLGPTRPFFSTYLESIWLLLLAIALDLLETADGSDALGARVRAQLIEPSACLIESYNEGRSNRQVWNSAALAAAGGMLGRPGRVDAALFGPAGLVSLLQQGVLPDGTWYEGENYHLFAHRGLWYLVSMAEHAGAQLPAALVRRFQEGFATPFLTALPDLTFPARRDSPYGVSLRQWRMAESCELGLARSSGDARLQGALTTLYAATGAPAQHERDRSTAEAERNVPAGALSRADLGWKSLLFALAEPGLVAAPPPESALLEGQGYGVIRRQAGQVYVAVDYGESGGGHGHPDRLNVWLIDRTHRVLEDPGTGSYVERALHWYRSTLAHNAPLANGRSQRMTDGEVLAWGETGDAGWIDARAVIAPGTLVRRSVVVMADYLVDRLEWSAPEGTFIDLPVHVDAEPADGTAWRPEVLRGSTALEDGFEFLSDTESAGALDAVRLTAGPVGGWLAADTPHCWWRAIAPGPPASGPRRFHLVRVARRAGTVWSVWSWGDTVRGVTREASALGIACSDGARYRHMLSGRRWRVERLDGERPAILELGGERDVVDDAAFVRSRENAAVPAPVAVAAPIRIPVLRSAPVPIGELTALARQSGVAAPVVFHLAEPHYRRSEASWREAGAPEAEVTLGATAGELLIEVSVRKDRPTFAPARSENPLDNEHPDINSDGVQVHVRGSATDAAGHASAHAWLLVPEAPGARVRVTQRLGEEGPVSIAATWRPLDGGYQLLARLPRGALGVMAGRAFGLDVLVNETAPGRARRRGQLVLSGAAGEWVYLRGDRQDPERMLAFVVAE